MPEENNGHTPSGNPISQPLTEHPPVNLPKQSVMAESSASNTQTNVEAATEELKREVHWVTHATFWSQVVLALIGLTALWIYYGQLTQMIHATQAAQDSAYDACVSAMIARQTLIEVQSGGIDTHATASGTVAQAAVTTRGESPLLSFGVMTINQTGQQPATPTQSGWPISDGTKIGLLVTNIGRSASIRQHIRYAAQLLSQNDEPSLHDSKINFDTAETAVYGPTVFVGSPLIMDLRYLDKRGKPIGPLSHDQLEDLRMGKLYLTFFGRADYSDVFGLDHWQTFCAVIDNFQINMSELPSKHIRHEGCTAYNNADKNLIYSIPPQFNSTTPAPQISDVKCTAPVH